MGNLKTIVVVLALALCGGVGCGDRGGPSPVFRLSRLELQGRVHQDVKNLKRYRRALKSMVHFAKSRPDIFPPEERRDDTAMLSREQKETLWHMWESMLDYFMALDSMRQYHSQYYRIEDEELSRHSFLVMFAAFLTQYAVALRFLELSEHEPAMDLMLNEPVPELGLGAKTFKRFKFRFLNVAIATEFLTLETIYNNYGKPDLFDLGKGIGTDISYIWKMGRGKGEKMTLKNALKLVEQAGLKALFPVQAGISEWMGDTKVRRRHRSLMRSGQIAELHAQLEPGDILLERREWYLSNIGLPGFWPHTALYIGTPEERRAFFITDAQTIEWVREQGVASGDLNTLLEQLYPEAYRKSVEEQEAGHVPRVLEAISEGVLFTTLEHSADCDSLGVLRPRLEKKELARAVVTAFHFWGRPYDFNFDFVTDSELVCTELIWLAFEAKEGFRGLSFPLVDMMGRKVTPANLMVKQFDEQYGTTEQQSTLVAFFDGYEKGGEAVLSDLEGFRGSWKRPKWHLLVQDRPDERE